MSSKRSGGSKNRSKASGGRSGGQGRGTDGQGARTDGQGAGSGGQGRGDAGRGRGEAERGRGEAERGRGQGRGNNNPPTTTTPGTWSAVVAHSPSPRNTSSNPGSTSRSRSRGQGGRDSSSVRGGRGGDTNVPYTGSAFGDTAQIPIIPSLKEPIHEYRGIRFVYNGELPQDRYQKMNVCMEKWVDDFIRKDGTVRDEQYRNPKEFWTPKYALVSKQGPHRTTTISFDGVPNPRADTDLHNTLHFMSEGEWNRGPPRGQGLHIYVDEKTHKYIPLKKGAKKRVAEDGIENHSWGKPAEIAEVNRPYIEAAKKRFKAKEASTSKGPTKWPKESGGNDPAEQANERLGPSDPNAPVYQDDAGVNYWYEGEGESRIRVGVVEGEIIRGYEKFNQSEGKGKAPATSASASASASTTTAKPKPATTTAAKPNTSQSTGKPTKGDGKVEKPASGGSSSDNMEGLKEVTGTNKRKFRKYRRNGKTVYEYLSSDGTWKPSNEKDWNKYCKK